MATANQAAGLYIHIPFCARKCPYCDFYSITDASLQTAYLEALLLEMPLCRPWKTVFDTIYLGGGTPSMLSLKAIHRIVAAVHDAFTIQKHAETTIEVNPGTIDAAKLTAYRQAAINRINIGVQSFDPANLGFLGRIHTVQESMDAVAAARRAGFDNIGIDLIYGLPGQKQADWQADLTRALALQPEHLACYMLTYEAGTPLDKARGQGQITPLDEEPSARLLKLTQEFLAAHGYVQYEISNFARNDGGNPEFYRSRHNLKYWNREPYLGLGPSAHSYEHPERWWNRRSVPDYIAALKAGRRPVAGQERLNRDQQMMEALYLGLRQTAGIDVAAFEKNFGVDFQTCCGEPLAEMIQEGVLTLADTRCALTPQGMPLLDSVIARLI